MLRPNIRLRVWIIYYCVIISIIIISGLLLEPKINSVIIDPEHSYAEVSGDIYLENSNTFPGKIKIHLDQLIVTRISPSIDQEKVDKVCINSFFINLLSPTVQKIKTGVVDIKEGVSKDNNRICWETKDKNSKKAFFPINIDTELAIDSSNAKFYLYPFDGFSLKLILGFSYCPSNGFIASSGTQQCLEETYNLPAMINLRYLNPYWESKVDTDGYLGIFGKQTLENDSYGDINQPGIKTTSSIVNFTRPTTVIIYVLIAAAALSSLPVVLMLINKRESFIELTLALLVTLGTTQIKNEMLPDPPPQFIVLDAFLIIIILMLIIAFYYRTMVHQSTDRLRHGNASSKINNDLPYLIVNINQLPENKSVVFTILTKKGSINYIGVAKSGEVKKEILKLKRSNIPGESLHIVQYKKYSDAITIGNQLVHEAVPKYNGADKDGHQ